MPGSSHLSRNEFVKVVVGALGTLISAVVGLPAIGYLLAPALKIQSQDAWVLLGTVEDIPIGMPTLFNFTRTKVNGWERTVNSYGVYVVRRSESMADIAAFSSTCTHLSCRVSWKEDLKEYVCPCHDAHFDIQGTVLSGPPPRPLDPYEVKVEEGKLSVRFVEG